MRGVLLRSFLMFFFLFPLFASMTAAQTTGEIRGGVEESGGGALPGVTVEAKSPALQGTRTTVTDGQGQFRFTQLPPGSYTLSFNLQGFTPVTQTVEVQLGRTATLPVALWPEAAKEEITVTSQAPVIDATSTALGAALDQRAIETLPTARNYAAIVQITPGVSSDANPENTQQQSITVYGSTGAENVFYIDGVNTTGVEYGFQGKELNFEFIQAVDVKTGGYEAELGRSTGGVINVITKSGGNEFHGDGFAYHDNDSLQASADDTVSVAGTTAGFTRQDFGADLGGYLVKDRLWFFAAYDRVSDSLDSTLPEGPDKGKVVTTESDRDLAAAKLTWRLGDSRSLVGTFFQDPRDDTGAINDAQHPLNGQPSTYLGVRSFGGHDYALRFDGVAGSDWIYSAQVARHNEENSVGPSTSEGAGVQLRDVSRNFFQLGGFGLVQTKEFQRDAAGGSLTHFLGNHELKTGIEYEEEKADVTRFYSGGQQVDRFQAGGRTVYSHFYWTTPAATLANAPISSLVASPKHNNTAVYLQDRWSLGPRLRLNLGLRWDRQQIFDASGERRVDLKDDYAPRLGFIWTPGEGNETGRQRVFGSYGRYYEQIPMDLVVRSFSFERQARIFNFDPVGVTPDAAAEALLGRDSAIFGGFTEPVDPDLRNQYIDEYIAGYEREVGPDLALGIKAVYRSYGEVIEDFLCQDDGTYCIGNPGRGIMRRIYTLDYSQTLPAPKPERKYKGVQLDLHKRFSKNWQGLATYLYSKLDGNFDGLYAPFTNVGADPNISAAYDYYDFFTNGSDLTRITNQGPLSNDRRHQFKVSGLYETSWKLSVGLSAYYRTGTPLTRYGYSNSYGRYEFFLSNRGAEGRVPDSYEADLHLGYPVQAGPVTINLLLDVFNILNAQRPILLDERWGFDEGDNGKPAPAPNPDYLKPVLRSPPTSARLGVRVSF